MVASCIALRALVGFVLGPLVAQLILAALGFVANGIVAHSIAAAIHSTIGVVSAGTLFAAAQSLGAGGRAPMATLLFSIVGAWAAIRFWNCTWLLTPFLTDDQGQKVLDLARWEHFARNVSCQWQ
eukprot:jgi/Botrbrau1/21758/Bobra.43_1s0148.2